MYQRKAKRGGQAGGVAQQASQRAARERYQWQQELQLSHRLLLMCSLKYILSMYSSVCVCVGCVCVCAHLSSSFFSTFAFALANSFAFISIVAKCNQITLMFPLMSFTLTLRARTAATTIADNNDNNEATHSHCATLPHARCCWVTQLLGFSALLF